MKYKRIRLKNIHNCQTDKNVKTRIVKHIAKKKTKFTAHVTEKTMVKFQHHFNSNN